MPIHRCCALKAKDNQRCTFKTDGVSDFCKIHQKAKKVRRYDDQHQVEESTGKIPSDLDKRAKEGKLIQVGMTPRLKFSTTRTRDLKTTLAYYKLPTQGSKTHLYQTLNTLFQGLYSFTPYLNSIILIQTTYRSYLLAKLHKLQGEASSDLSKCVNQEDVNSLDPLVDIPKNLLFTYQCDDLSHYGFDIRTIRTILQFDKLNPYTRIPLSEKVISRANTMLKLLHILGIDTTDEPSEQFSEELSIKRRVVKVFHDMDQLDQYTDPDWFLNLSVSKLISFYKEAEDVWNYRLNLTQEVKKAIVPPDGKVFNHTVKAVACLKSKKQLQQICLDFIEKLIYSAENRADRVNGCIYVLLGLVIVSRNAAQALPSYYSMVMGDDGLTMDGDIMV